MPFVVCRASVPMSAEQERELKRRLGRAIAHVPGKSERGFLWLWSRRRTCGSRETTRPARGVAPVARPQRAASSMHMRAKSV